MALEIGCEDLKWIQDTVQRRSPVSVISNCRDPAFEMF
jgi:hypothetical protein